MTYTEIIEKLAEAGGIDTIGVASEKGQMAICFSGAKPIKKYIGGIEKAAIIVQISCLGNNSGQKDIVQRLCDAGSQLTAAQLEVEGITQPTIKVTSPPTPTMHNEKYWIYSMIVEVSFYTKGLIL